MDAKFRMEPQRYNSSRNDLGKICLVSTFLGLIIGNSLYYHSKLSWYFILVGSFHINEFVATSKYLTNNVTDDLFLIWNNRGSKEYWMVQMLTVLEFMYLNLRPQHQIWSMVSLIGVILLVIGIILRFLSIKTLGSSFTHYINQQETTQELVVTGIFQYVRHPSYLGFYLYVVGIEIYLKNLGCFILSMAILTHFFRVRIRFEEYHLVKQYGQSYNRYKNQVKTYIPFV